MANIVILGGGFGGLVAAEQLAASFITGAHKITLVSRQPEFVFYPALVQVAFGKLEPSAVKFNLAAKLAVSGVRFVEGEVVQIDAERQAVQIAGEDFDGDLHYDYLIIALGRQLATSEIEGFFEHAHHLLGVGAAVKFGDAVRNFKKGGIVVGMCLGASLPVPPCETAFALARKFEREIAGKEIDVSIVFPESIAAAFGGAGLHRELQAAFEKHNINLVTDFRIAKITADAVQTNGGDSINYDLLMLVPPFRGQALLTRMEKEVADERGYARVNGLMQLKNLPNAFAVGDVVAFSGPKFAHMAVRQAKVAAENIVYEISGEQRRAEYYHEISTVIDQGGSDTIYLHYGIWDDELFRLQKSAFWSWAKSLHDRYWQAVHS